MQVSSAQVLMPSESKVEVLGGTRDTIPDSRPVYQLILSYSLSLPKSAEVRLERLQLFVIFMFLYQCIYLVTVHTFTLLIYKPHHCQVLSRLS